MEQRSTTNSQQLDDIRQQAMDLLRDPELHIKYLDTMNDLGLVGDEVNKTTMLLAGTSRKLPKPINLHVEGPSSIGKSFEVETILKSFPAEEVILLSGLSPKALYYYDDSFVHKILVVTERTGGEGADYPIRTLQSEGRLRFIVTVKNPQSGRFTTQTVEKDGPISYWETTAQVFGNQENLSRCFTLCVDGSESQTKAIHLAQAHTAMRRRAGPRISLAVWQEAQRLLQPLPVAIPYADKIEFPTKPLRVRRDFPRFLALIEADAFLHQFQREQVALDGQPYIMANLEDYAIAYRLVDRLLTDLVVSLEPVTVQLIEAAQRIADGLEKGSDRTFTRTDLESTLGWNRKTITGHVTKAIEAGYVQQLPSSAGGAYQYRMAKIYAPGKSLLLNPEELANKTGVSNPVQGWVNSTWTSQPSMIP